MLVAHAAMNLLPAACMDGVASCSTGRQVGSGVIFWHCDLLVVGEREIEAVSPTVVADDTCMCRLAICPDQAKDCRILGALRREDE